MNTYLALFLIATFASLVITPLVRRLCERFRLLDVPGDGRRLHGKAVPRLGGVAIFAAVVIALSTLPFVDNLLTQTLRAHKSELLLALIPAMLVLFLGIYDDLRGTDARVKFIVLGLISMLFYAMGGRIEGLSIPFVGSVHLPPVIAYALTIFWLVGIANAFNLIDGMDGLASGAALFSSIVILVVSFTQGRPLMIVVALILSGALAGFLRYNFNPASIFLGDSGALFVGFTLAALSVLSTQKATTAVAVIIPIMAFGLPVVDTGVTMARRLISRRPIFQGDSEHIHHMLLARGWSQRRVVLVLYAVCAGFGLLAMLFASSGSHLPGFILFVVGVVVIIAVGHLRYHEMDEIKAGVKRTVSDRRLRMANNIRVRRASRALSRAGDLNQVLEAVGQMLEFGEFGYAEVRLGRTREAKTNEQAVRLAVRAGLEVELRGSRICWSWARAGTPGNDVAGSSRFWSLRLPLSTDLDDLGWIELYRAFDDEPLLVDMSYLSDLFRRELSSATQRVLRATSERDSARELGLSMSAGKI